MRATIFHSPFNSVPMRSLQARFSPHQQGSPILLQVLAFAAVYLIWGSTYLAIFYAIESFPPFLMLGIRFGLAGVLMYTVLRIRGHEKPSLAHVKSATVMGVLLLFIGTGCIAWAEAHIPTGLAALLVATVPLWIVLLEWLWLKGPRPSWNIMAAVAFGLVGVAIVVEPPAQLGGDLAYYSAIAVSLFAALTWSVGSLLGRKMDLPSSPFMGAALQMIAGGLVLSLFGLAIGEAERMDWSAVTTTSVMAVGYLFLFGSLIAFSAFVWLMKNVAPSRVSTYAFINPIVAVLLGTLIAGEALTFRIVVAGVFLIAAVVIIVRNGRRIPAGRQSRLQRHIAQRRREVEMVTSLADRHPLISRLRYTMPLSRKKSSR